MNAPAADALHRPASADGLGLGSVLSLAVHLGLVAALAVSVSWRRHSVQPVSAELWAAVPQLAAPPAEAPGVVEPAPPPAPEPEPVPVQAPPPAPRPAPAPPPPAPTPAELAAARAEADIATERARRQREAEAQRRADKERADKERAEKEATRELARKKAAERAEQAEAEKLAAQKRADKLAADKLAADRKAAEKKTAEKLEADRKLAERKDAERRAAEAARSEKARTEQVARLREDALKRMQNQLGGAGASAGSSPPTATGSTTAGTGAPGSTGTAARSAAPTAGYEGRIRARILPNIVYTGRVSRSIVADVEIRVANDGTIIGKRLTKSSGVPDWDEAVLRAIEKTEILPRDTDGRIPPVMTISLDPGSR